MALPRYNPSEVRLQPGAASVAHQQVASEYQNLSNMLSQWSGVAAEELGKQKAREAEEQAYQDTINNKPFHKESVYTIYGQAYNTTRKATYTAQLEMDISKKSDELSAQFQDDPQGYQNAMQGYMKGLKDETPDSSIEASLSISGEKLISTQFNKLQQVKIKKQQKADLVTYEVFKGQKQSQLINAIIDGDTKTADLIKHQMEEMTTSLMTSGTLSDDKYIEDVAENDYIIKSGVITGMVQKSLNNNDIEEAEDLYKEFGKKIPPGFTAAQHKTVKTSLRTQIAGAKKEQRASAKEQKELANEALDNVIKVLNNGKTPTKIPSDEDMKNASPSKVKKLKNIVKANEQLDKYRDLTLIEQEVKFREMKSKETGTPLDVDVQKELEQIINNRRTAWNSDPISQGQIEGMYQPVEIKMEDPNIVDNLMTRFRQSKINIDEAGQGAWHLLTKSEADFFGNYLGDNSGATIEEKQQFISTLKTFPDEVSDKLYKQIGKKRAYNFVFAGNLSKIGNDNAAQVAMQGANADVKLPEGIKQDIQTKLGGIFRGQKADEYNTMVKGIQDYAKGLTMRGVEVSDGILNSSIDDIFEQTIGKVNKYNNMNVVLPFGVEESSFEDWLDNIIIPDRPNLQEGLRDTTDSFMKGNHQLHYYGNGQYKIWNDNGGNGFYERASNDPKSPDFNKPYVLDWNKK
jgi:hypothetical protein